MAYAKTMSMLRALTWMSPALGLVVYLFSSAAQAECVGLPELDADAQRLSQLGRSFKTNVVPQGKTERYGHAEVLINAPMARVRQQVTDYAHYKEFVPDKFHNARVIGKDRMQGTTDLYFAIDVMKGLIKLTNTLRFGAPRVLGPGFEVVEGTFVRGTNVKDANIILTMREVFPNFTVLKIDLLILPTIPAPQSAIDEELRDAAQNAVDAIHDRAQGHNRVVPLITGSN